MQIVKQDVKLLNISHDNPLDVIESSARNCYNSPSNPETQTKFIKSLLRRKHLTPFEMVDVQVELVTSRGVMAELTRHRHCSFNIESTRYCNYKDGIKVVLPVEFNEVYKLRQLHRMDCMYVDGVKELTESPDNINYCTWSDSCSRAEGDYKSMLGMGCAPQLARSVLPNSLATTIIMKTNLRDWMNIFELRTARGAHPDIVALMIDLREQFRAKIPVVFDESN